MSERLLVCTRKGLFDVRPSGRGVWAPHAAHFLGSPCNMALKDPRDGAIYACLDLGHFGVKLHRSNDDGATWTEIAAPSYAGVAGDEPPSLKLIWSLETGGADEPGVLWAGTIPGGLFRSEDYGETWSLIRSLWDDPSREHWFGGGYDKPGIHSICVDPRNSRHIAIAISCAGVWETVDGGENWRLAGEGLWAAYMPPDQKHSLVAQDPHRMVRSPSAPDQFWLQHHNGAFHAASGVSSWVEVTPKPTTFGFAVAVHPQRPDVAWFVPAVKDEYRYPQNGELVVARTSDGGASFEMLRNGLPQAHAYDLIYRHGLEVDETGERLAMGSTTGGLWISENGGNLWTAAEARLPPVYAVRFI